MSRDGQRRGGRPWLGAVLAGAAAVAMAGPVLAAPTCFDAAGAPIRCGTPGAMPVGWTPTPEQAADHAAQTPDPGPAEIVGMIYVVGAIFALIALMPPFDGRDGGGWDEQEGDRGERGRR